MAAPISKRGEGLKTVNLTQLLALFLPTNVLAQTQKREVGAALNNIRVTAASSTYAANLASLGLNQNTANIYIAFAQSNGTTA